jgi:hypothetical protein
LVTAGINTTNHSVVVVGLIYSGANFTSFVDSNSNTWVQVGVEHSFASSQRSRVYQCANLVGGAGHTFTLNLATAQVCTILVQEGLTAGGGGQLDQSVDGPNDTTSPYTSANITTTVNDEMLFEVDCDDSNTGTGAHTLGNSFTRTAEEQNATNLWSGDIGYRIVTATGTYSTSMTFGGTLNGSTAYLVSFSEAAAGGATAAPAPRRFGFPKVWTPGRGRLRPSPPAQPAFDASIPALADPTPPPTNPRFGFSPKRTPGLRRMLRASRTGMSTQAAGTQFNQAIDGTMTSAGVLVKQGGKVLAGTLTSSAALLRQAGKVLAGTLTTAGALLKLTSKFFTGILTSSSVLASIKTVLKDLGTNTLATAGALLKRAQLVKVGTLTTAGALLKQTNKFFTGTLTSAGVLTSIKIVIKDLGTNTLATAGALLKRANKPMTATLTTAGALLKLTSKAFVATLTSSGTLTSIKTFLKDLGTNTLTTAGALLKRTGKPLTATVTSAGALLKQTNKFFVATLTSSGAFTKIKLVFKDLGTNTLATAGALLKRTSHPISATLAMAGVLLKRTTKTFSGVLASAGTVVGNLNVLTVNFIRVTGVLGIMARLATILGRKSDAIGTTGSQAGPRDQTGVL